MKIHSDTFSKWDIHDQCNDFQPFSLIEVSKINQKKIDLPRLEILHSASNFDWILFSTFPTRNYLNKYVSIARLLYILLWSNNVRIKRIIFCFLHSKTELSTNSSKLLHHISWLLWNWGHCAAQVTPCRGCSGTGTTRWLTTPTWRPSRTQSRTGSWSPASSGRICTPGERCLHCHCLRHGMKSIPSHLLYWHWRRMCKHKL